MASPDNPLARKAAAAFSAGDVWDKVAQGLMDFRQGDAMGRFTQTPIRLEDPNPAYSEWTGWADPNKISISPPGEYLQNYTKEPTSSDSTYNDVAAHEQIHALLMKAGLSGQLPQDWQPPRNQQQKITFNPQTLNFWNRAGRAGVYEQEMPAYLGAYVPGQIPNLNTQLRAKLLSHYRDLILTDPKVRKTFHDIVKTQGYGHPALEEDNDGK